MPVEWNPQSWRGRTALQQPDYPDAEALESVLDELRRLPPLVTSWEITHSTGKPWGADSSKKWFPTSTPAPRHSRKIILKGYPFDSARHNM